MVFVKIVAKLLAHPVDYCRSPQPLYDLRPDVLLNIECQTDFNSFI